MDERPRAVPELVDRDRRSNFDPLGEANDVPVGQPDAAMTDGMSYGIRSGRAMHADAFFVERNPENANRASRTGRQHVEMATPLPVLQHFFVVAKPRHLGHSPDFPISNG